MISIIVGTSRPGNSLLAARTIAEMVEKQGLEYRFLSMSEVDHAIYQPHTLYNYAQPDPKMLALREIWTQSDLHIYVIPEYNGSFPGELKLLIDAMSTVGRDEIFKGKLSLLIGVSNGRAGNIRGLEDLTGVLNYLGTIVWPQKTPLSLFKTLLSADQTQLADAATLAGLENLLNAVLAYREKSINQGA
jgi:chromate reductase, NAD(P)H dehydrogenase (quinone)